MTAKQYFRALIQNMVAQVNADLNKHVPVTWAQVYDMLIATVNAYYSVGLLPEIGSEEAYDDFVDELKAAGLSELITTAETQIGHDVATAWPWVKDRSA